MTQIKQSFTEHLKSEHTKKLWQRGVVENELCNACEKPMPQNTYTALFGVHYECFQKESIQSEQESA